MSQVYEIELEDGRVIELEADKVGSQAATPTTEVQKPKQLSPNFSNEMVQRVDNQIASRPSMMKSLIQDPSTLQRLAKHPLGTPLRTIGGALELAEGVPSSIGLDLQRGRPQNIISNLGKVVTGERPVQRGDIMRQVGTPEPIAGAVGLMAGAGKVTPDAAIGNMVTGAASKMAKVTGITNMLQKYGKPVVAKTLSFLSGTPEDKVLKAIENPNFLSKKWIDKEKSIVQKEYDAVVKPAIQDSSKIVNTKSLSNVYEDLGMKNPNGTATRSMRSLSKSEMKKFSSWKAEVDKGNLSFNDVDGLIGEMDESLSSVYKAKASGKAVDYSDDFIRNTTKFRDKLNDLRKTQFPEVGKVLERYANLKDAENVYKNFDRWYPHLMPAIVSSGILGSLGMRDPRIYGSTITTAIPKVQGFAIRGASALKNNLLKSGAVLPEAVFEQWRNSQ